ncbi:DUF2235 domain-containing protein [Bradyrhizobium sp.]|uniref:DUF2235 domain-containing protein n=1 Tax=Bradyrhizobium sp. TaxID=376 RepID=UPI001DCF287C|nr:DUF2235 domain-containing protein [Bradyrhizobium sp.]MBI5323533.1 DUF2235 domain-containing protein [Bradyrhizobium sp.]
MSKNIVLLSDGTGNSSAKVFKTNVWRLFQILDLGDPARQIAFYDDGVGTSSFKLFAILGGVFGFGLKRNVIDIYSFCCRNYRPGDRIYGFGFSRGSFTMRVVAGMIAREGLVPYSGDEAALARHAADAYRAYRRRFNITKGLVTPLRDLRDLCIKAYRHVRGIPQFDGKKQIEIESIHFLGLWDTVDAYGGPIEEMTRAIDYWIWPLSMPDRFLNAKVHRACHALALEDERDAFRPVIWDERYVRGRAEVAGREKKDWLFGVEHDPRSDAAKAADPAPHLRMDLPPIDRERISQVWFTGVHADIGGGYPQDGLSHVALDWMLDRAQPYGLLYSAFQRQHVCGPQINPYDKLNDSRKGLAGYYRYKPRNIKETYEAPPYKPSFRADVATMWRLLRKQHDPQTEILADLHPSMPQTVLPPPQATVHEAVFQRIRHGTDRYVPVVMPRQYKYTDKAGAVTRALHPVDPGNLRSRVQDDVWNWIWLRRVVYFLTVLATLLVVGIPFFVIYFPGVGLSWVGAFVNPLVNAAASFLPGFLEPWFVAFRNAPGLLLAGSIVVGGFLWLGSNLQHTIRDVSRVAWHAPAGHPTPGGWHAAVHKLRRAGIYRVTFYFLKHWLFPTAIVVWLFWWLAFGTANTLGLICKGEGGVLVEDAAARPAVMQTAKACNATGLRVAQGETYRITLKVTDAWKDHMTETGPNGFDNSRAPWMQLWGWPYKRLIWSNWFATILRVGGPGLEEHLLQFEGKEGGIWTATFAPRANGEVFLYVNDTVLSFPWIYDLFYRCNNHGKAEVTIEKLPKPGRP